MDPNRRDTNNDGTKREKNPIYKGICNDKTDMKKARYFVVMGLAIHLTGDTYAHWTIVPQYTVKGTNPKKKKLSKSINSFDARFGTENFKDEPFHKKETDAILKTWAKESHENQNKICKRWNCFQRTINLGVMEIKDIKNYAIKDKKDYEDNANFCKERFEDAKSACDYVFYSSYEKYAYDGVEIFMPLEGNVKLNDFWRNAKLAGEGTSVYSAARWKKASTPEKY